MLYCISLCGADLCLWLTSDNQSVWDSRLIEHSLDVVVVESEGPSFPALWVHQQHHSARTRQLAHRHPYRERETKQMINDRNEKRKDKTGDQLKNVILQSYCKILEQV